MAVPFTYKLYPLLTIFDTSPSKDEIYVSAVRVQVLVSSRVTFTVPASVDTVSPFALVI